MIRPFENMNMYCFLAYFPGLIEIPAIRSRCTPYS